MKGIVRSMYFSWGILALPMIPFVFAIISDANLEGGLTISGEFAARFIILCMMITPMSLIFRTSVMVKWLRLRRRAIGVAAFCYALLHTIVYIADAATVSSILDEFCSLGMWTGWAALIILTPLALTSKDSMVRMLRDRWKALHRWIYVAAILVLFHWVFVQSNLGFALVHFIPLILLQSIRMYIDVWVQEPASSN